MAMMPSSGYGTASPAPNGPRDLLWHFQIKREHQYLLERMSKQEGRLRDELIEVRRQLSATRKEQDTLGGAIHQLGEKGAEAATERRNDIAREREMLKRVVEVETTSAFLKRGMEGLGNEVADSRVQSSGVESRLRILEQRPWLADQEVPGLRRRVEVLEDVQRVRLLAVTTAPCEEQTDQRVRTSSEERSFSQQALQLVQVDKCLEPLEATNFLVSLEQDKLGTKRKAEVTGENEDTSVTEDDDFSEQERITAMARRRRLQRQAKALKQREKTMPAATHSKDTF